MLGAVRVGTTKSILTRFRDNSLSRYLWAALLTVNFIGLAITLAAFLYADIAADWTQVYSQLGPRIPLGALYDWPNTIFAYRYSPLLAYAFAGISWIGVWGWLALHFAVLPLLGRRLALFALLSWPFWSDVYNGNVMTFIFIAAVLALRGNRTGQVAFLAIALLIPRPLMLPVMVWLLWRVPWTRWAFLVVATIEALLVWLTGYGQAWLGALLSRGGDDIASRMDFGPAHLIGTLWVPLGLLLAAYFTWRGRLGLASIAASPYWLPHYLLMALLPVSGQTRSSHLAKKSNREDRGVASVIDRIEAAASGTQPALHIIRR